MNEVEIRVGARDESGPGIRQAENRFRGLRRVGQAAAVGLGAAGAAGGAMFASGLAANMNIEVANDKLAAQLGLTTEEAEKAGEVAGEVYGNNWGSSIEDVNAAIKSVGDNLGDVGTLSKAELQGMTESALALASTFDVDVAESTRAAGALIKNGLAKNSTEAFDIITAGFQNGANKAGDFTDTISEYSPQFKKLGFDGKYTLDLLSEGLKAGARDSDVLADAFKEFGLRAIDGSKTTVQAYKDIGLNAKDTAKAIAGGGPAAQVATQQTLEALLSIKDPIKQNNAGVALFGTTWEDTVRTILPALANADGAIEKVDGSTKRMADTVGDNAQGKIDTLKRGFEQWTQKMASSEGQLGLVATGVGEFGGGAVSLAGNLGMVAVAMRGVNLAMLANPIGLVVVAIAALAAGMVYLWKNSETAREVMSTAFAAIGGVVLLNITMMVKGARMLLSAWMTVVGGILDAVAKIPGPTQDAAKKAAKSFDDFRSGVDKTFDRVEGKLDEYKKTVRDLPKKIRLQADEKDLQAKLRHAQASLRKLPANKRTRVLTDITRAQRSIAAIQARLRGIKDQYVSVFVSEVQRDRATSNRGRASGGIIGAASGGARGSWTMVGEAGRELVKLPYGSQVTPNGATENIMRGGHRGGAPVVLEIKSGGSRIDDLIVEIIRASVRARGGNVQLVLGK